MSRAAGFTLVELIAVLVLLSLLILFSPIALNALVAERELEHEVSRLGNLIELVHMQAILDGVRYAMHYDTDDHRYAIQTPVRRMTESNDLDDEPTEVLFFDQDIDPDQLDWHQLPRFMHLRMYEGRTQLRGRYRVVFDPRGTVDPHTLIIDSDRISSLDDDDRARTIKVNFPGFVGYAPGERIEEFKKTEAELGR